MGRALVAAAQAPGFSVTAAIERADSPALGRDAGDLAGVGSLGVPVAAVLDPATFDVLIDFTHPEATAAHVTLCRAAGKKIVIGTTGLDEPFRRTLMDAARAIAIVQAPNMSVGVNLLFHLADIAARALGEDADVEIIEAHHRHKLDAPSGTALRLGEVVAEARGRSLKDIAVYDRHGANAARVRGSIGFATVRAGEIIGDHTVLYALAGERVEVTHHAESRATFAHGALRAAHWLMGRASGLYDMQDVLGLR